MIKIPLKGDRFALVDDCDAHLASHIWTINHRWGGRAYAQRNGSDAKTVYLHREVLGLQKGDGKYVDHINGDGLDCRRENLRICTCRQNLQNRMRHMPGFKGVARTRCGWTARIRVNGKYLYLGHFQDPESAARAYDAGARRHFGEFAAVNFPRPGERGCRPPDFVLLRPSALPAVGGDQA